MEAVIFKKPGEEWLKIGGMTLYERNLRYLEAEGVTKAWIIHPSGDMPPEIEVPRPLALKEHLTLVARETADPLEALSDLDLTGDSGVFVLNANLLADRRVYPTLKERSTPCFLVADQGNDTAESWLMGWVDSDSASGGSKVLENTDRITLKDVPLYARELRGNWPPFCEILRSRDDLERGWQLLIRRTQKRQNDVIEKYVHPGMQNWMTRKLVDTSITPNQISLVVIIFAVVAAVLFFKGSFLTAYVMAFIATVLDGVDGKLARVKLMTSPVGKLEHVFDYFYENAWYVCLAANLAVIHGAVAWKVGLSIVALDTTDKIIGALFGKFMGKTLDEAAPFDGFFRFIGGRRSIYIHILLVGFLLSAPFPAFKAVLFWAAVTVGIHAVRALYHAGKRKKAA